ncbi:MAG: SCO family protein [bacterium]
MDDSEQQDRRAHRFPWKSSGGRDVLGSCRTACPTIIGDMKRIEAGLNPTAAAQTTFLLVTFDPKVDTPAELKHLEEKFELGEHWVFLHGEPGSIRELATVLDVQYREISEGQFSHTNRITLLDHNGLIASKIDGLKQPSDALVTTLNTFGDK